MPESEQISIIYNPAAGGGRAAGKWQKCHSQLKRSDIPFEFHMTEHPGHATEIAQDLLSKGIKRIAVFGGDGTFNEVIQARFRDSQQLTTEPAFIYLGAGSSCDFERSLSGQPSWLDRLRSEQVVAADVCQAEYRDFEGNPVTRYFINNSSIGVLSRAGYKFNTATGFLLFLKRVNVDVAAVVIGIITLLKRHEILCDLTLDEDFLPQQKISNITVFKTPYFAGGMNYGVTTKLDDGQLHVGVVDSTSRLRLMSMMISLYTGKIFRRTGTRYLQCQEIELRTDDRVAVETDGEILGYPPIRYTLLKQAINVVV